MKSGLKLRHFIALQKKKWEVKRTKGAAYLLNLYTKTGLIKVHYFFQFLFHRYGPQQFEIRNIKSNAETLLTMQEGEPLECDSEGKLETLKTFKRFRWVKWKNRLSFGAVQSRLEKVVYFTLLTLCLEIHNPFTINILEGYIARKTALLERILKKMRKINGHDWREYRSALLNIELFKRNSLNQLVVIQGVEKVIRRAEEPPIVKDVKNALKMGLFPLLVIQGLSGGYWMRGTNREIAGLFKPFDEEAYAPNNPGGPPMQGALGQRRMRPGIRVGECIHREVAAFVVDQFFGFGMVPKTYYASFSHHVFFQAGTSLDVGALQRPIRTKMGSFQEYIDGFINLIDLPKEKWSALPEIEVQLLILLDVILGNCDRNMGNILLGEGKIAAIDHGLCLSDINYHLSSWYWKALEQGKKPLPSSMIDLLKNFPFEELRLELQKKCLIDLPAFERLRERVVLFREGVLLGYSPHDLADLFSDENMKKLYGLNDTLASSAREIIENQMKERQANKQES